MPDNPIQNKYESTVLVKTVASAYYIHLEESEEHGFWINLARVSAIYQYEADNLCIQMADMDKSIVVDGDMKNQLLEALKEVTHE